MPWHFRSYLIWNISNRGLGCRVAGTGRQGRVHGVQVHEALQACRKLWRRHVSSTISLQQCIQTSPGSEGWSPADRRAAPCSWLSASAAA